jgi:hypothetical protein
MTSLSLLSRRAPSAAQIHTYERILKELTTCYSRCAYNNAELSKQEKVDFGITVYTLIFILCWSRNDFENLHILFQISDNADTLLKYLSEDPLEFYNVTFSTPNF